LDSEATHPVDDTGGDTSFTFPTRTFVWDVQDQDGVETITDIYFALDDTCSIMLDTIICSSIFTYYFE
jgi:hypothetical protein